MMAAWKPPRVSEGRFWRSGKLQHDFKFDKISDYLAEPDALVWADLCDPDHEALCELADELGLDRWAVEDSVSAAERVKATNYSTHTFLTIYGIPVVEPQPSDPSQSMLSMRRISAFVLAQALITVRLSPAFDIDKVTQRWDDIGGQEYGVGALVHGLLDVVVDSHFEAAAGLRRPLGAHHRRRIVQREGVNRRSSAPNLPDAQRLDSTTSRGPTHAGGRQLDAASSPRCGHSP